jgi:hypothetical protein
MRKRTCLYCGQEFLPCVYHPEQKVCSSAACQRRRRTEYHRHRLAQDREYREACGKSQENWLENNPGYMARYGAARRARIRSDTKKYRLPDELCRVLNLEKNNVAFDPVFSGASVWLIRLDGVSDAMKSFAGAEAIVLKGDLCAVIARKAEKNNALKIAADK